MKTYVVQITQVAKGDLINLNDYITNELKSPKTAESLLSEIKEAVLGLMNMPLRQALVADERLAGEGIRRIFIKNYVLFYIVSEESSTVTVVRILYGRRDWINLL